MNSAKNALIIVSRKLMTIRLFVVSQRIAIKYEKRPLIFASP